MSSASELFRRAVRKLNPHQLSIDPEKLEWLVNSISNIIETIEQWDEEWAQVQKDKVAAAKKLQAALETMRIVEQRLQQRCDHDFHRGTAECDSICRHCGADESDVTPLPQETS